MEPVDTETVREIRAALESNLPHLCEIQRNTGGLVSGSPRVVWTSAAEPVACMLSPIGGDAGQANDQNQPAATWTVRLPVGTSVAEGNRLLVTGVDLFTD